jgi:DNA-binding transcriptional ArsR family regulator
MFNNKSSICLWKMIPLLNVGFDSFDSSYLSQRDAEVLSLLEQEDLTAFTFDGLKRRLGLHQETLSRILTRLEEEGIIKKEDSGYRVTPRIESMKLAPANVKEETVPLLQTYLPSNTQVQRLITNLRGKWFGLLRWFGLSENAKGVALKWVTEDGGIQIDAVIADSVLTIEAKFLRENNLNTALSASYQLMGHISTLCSGSASAKHVGFFGNTDAFLMPA